MTATELSQSAVAATVRVFGGSGEIRTHERLPVAGFQDRCNRPLCHASSGPYSNCPRPVLGVGQERHACLQLSQGHLQIGRAHV